MTPIEFHDEVAQPNMQLALENPGDTRAMVNAVMTLDALAGLIHARGIAAGDRAMTKHRTDDKYRDELAGISRSFQVMRDTAASFKHGELTGTKARLVRDGGCVRSVHNQCGLFQTGDMLGGNVVVIEFDGGPGYVRATGVIADSYRMLKRILDGDSERLDEHDYLTAGWHAPKGVVVPV